MNRFVVISATLVLVAGIAVALYPSAKRGEFTGVLSSRRADALGAKALFHLFVEGGLAPKRRVTDLEVLPARGVLFLLGPESPRTTLAKILRLPTFSKHEREAVERWVRKGGRLVMVSAENTGIHRDFGVRIVDVDEGEPPESSSPMGLFERAMKARAKRQPARQRARRRQQRARARKRRALDTHGGSQEAPAHVTPLTGDATALSASRFYHFDTPHKEHETLFSHDDRPVATAVTRGKGVAVFVSTPFVASNVGLSRGGNARFFFTLAELLKGSGGLYVDEYHHGQRRPRGLIALASNFGLHFAIAQALLAALLAVWGARRLRRMGRVRRPEARGADDHLAAMATLYERGGLTDYAIERLWNTTLATVAERFGLRGAKSGASVAIALRSLGREDLAASVQSLEARCREARQGKVRERDLIQLTRAMAELRDEVEGHAGRRWT